MSFDRGVQDAVACDVAIVVPAHNEQDHLGPCLSALAAARAHLALIRPEVRTRMLVVLDSCTDGSAEIAAAAGVDAITVAYRNVGAARRAGSAAALADVLGPCGSSWLVSTDADCEVPREWLTTFADAADDGYAVVLGMVRPGPGLSDGERRAWLRRHRYQDGHPHVHGANLGVRADTYGLIGGWRTKVTGEDVDLVARAEALGVPMLRTARHPVMTSARRAGRAPSGFADFLCAGLD